MSDLHEVRLTAKDFERFPRILRRYTPTHLLHLTRLPRRRRRFMRQGEALAAGWRKSLTAQRKMDGSTLVVGPLSDTNGLGRAARYEIEKLRAQCPRLQEIDVRHSTPEMVKKWIASGKLNKPDILIVLAQPDNYKYVFPLFEPGFLTEAWRIGQLVWEMQYCPREWMFVRELLHEFWSPSRFSAEALASGLQLPYEVRPHHVAIPDVKPMDRSRFGVAEADFLGIAIMDLRACPDRKNPLAHVEAWQRAFSSDPKCKLLMKVRFQKRTHVVRRELQELIGRHSNIILVEDVFTDAEIAAFQKMGDVLVSLHRSEGYGLNIKEALEIGMPVVATDWAAPTEYFSEYPNAYPVRCTQAPYRDYLRTYNNGQLLWWAEPDVLAAAVILRDIRHQFESAKIGK